MTFVEAFALARDNKIIRRAGWKKNKIVFYRPQFECDAPTFEKIVSVPPDAKKWISDVILSDDFEGHHIYTFTGYLSLFTGIIIQNIWIPSEEDVQADDWIVANE